MTDVIVHNAYGNIDVYPATLEHALKLVNLQVFSGDYSNACEFFENIKNKINISGDMVCRAIHDVCMLPVDTPSKYLNALTDGKYRTITADIKNETIIYLWNHQITIKHPTYSGMFGRLTILQPQRSLTYLKQFDQQTDCYFYYPDQLDRYSQLRCIIEGRWKETASEISKIKYIVEFLNEHYSNDSKFYITSIQE